MFGAVAEIHVHIFHTKGMQAPQAGGLTQLPPPPRGAAAADEAPCTQRSCTGCGAATAIQGGIRQTTRFDDSEPQHWQPANKGGPSAPLRAAVRGVRCGLRQQ